MFASAHAKMTHAAVTCTAHELKAPNTAMTELALCELLSHDLHKELLHACKTGINTCIHVQLQQSKNSTQVGNGERGGGWGEASGKKAPWQAYLGSSVSEIDTSLVATTSTLMPLLLKMSKTVPMKPTCPSILVLTMSNRVMPGLSTMLVIKASFMSRSSDMSVPAAALHGWKLSTTTH